MFIQTAFIFSSVVQRWVCRFSGLRLLALCRFQAFLASSPCAESASSYHFCSSAQPRWRSVFSQFVPVAKFKLPFLASGSNLPVKPTRILRSAYLARYSCSFQPMNIQTPFTLASAYPLGVWRSLGLRLRGLRQFQAFLASTPCAASVGSSGFRSPWPVRSLSFLRFGSNPALKPTRILRAAYLVR